MTLLLLIGVPVAVCAIFMGDASNSCREGSAAVAKARGLSEDRLSALYRDMKIHVTAADTPLEGYSRFTKDDKHAIPPEFADLGAVRVRPHMENIMLEGCLDAGVDLQFDGLMDSTQPERIVLTWGDHHEWGEQVLWKGAADSD